MNKLPGDVVTEGTDQLKSVKVKELCEDEESDVNVCGHNKERMECSTCKGDGLLHMMIYILKGEIEKVLVILPRTCTKKKKNLMV